MIYGFIFIVAYLLPNITETCANDHNHHDSWLVRKFCFNLHQMIDWSQVDFNEENL